MGTRQWRWYSRSLQGWVIFSGTCFAAHCPLKVAAYQQPSGPADTIRLLSGLAGPMTQIICQGPQIKAPDGPTPRSVTSFGSPIPGLLRFLPAKTFLRLQHVQGHLVPSTRWTGSRPVPSRQDLIKANRSDNTRLHPDCSRWQS